MESGKWQPFCIGLNDWLHRIKGGGHQIVSAIDYFSCRMPSIRSSDNDSTGFWPTGSLHTLGADGHI